jgi:general secretion pathway protein A
MLCRNVIMYERFFGLLERPFDLTPNPRYLLLTPQHSEALSTLRYGIAARKGIVLLTGEAGTGKTTLVRSALSSPDAPGRVVHLTNPTLTRAEFLEFLAEGFGLDGCASSKTQLLLQLSRLLQTGRAESVSTVLVIDEAQCLSGELLEEIRLLANIETDTDKLLTVILAGQPELNARLQSADLRQLTQRIALRCSLSPLSLQETGSYITGRIRLAGGEAKRLFTKEAVQLIYENSRGIPRSINVICDNALLTAFAINEQPVSRSTVLEVCRDLNLGKISTGGASASEAAARTLREGWAIPGPTRSGAGPTPPISTGGRENSKPLIFASWGQRRRFLFF